MPLHNNKEEDISHLGHNAWHIETVHDNPVEFTEWWHCADCNVNYRAVSVTILGEP